MGLWNYFIQNPEYNIVLNEAMTSNSGRMSLVLRDIYAKL